MTIFHSKESKDAKLKRKHLHWPEQQVLWRRYKKTYETRTKDANWTVDTSIYSFSIYERFKDDLNNPLSLALLEEENSLKKAKNFKRTTPKETFADNHYDPFYCPVYSRVY